MSIDEQAGYCVCSSLTLVKSLKELPQAVFGLYHMTILSLNVDPVTRYVLSAASQCWRSRSGQVKPENPSSGLHQRHLVSRTSAYRVTESTASHNVAPLYDCLCFWSQAAEGKMYALQGAGALASHKAQVRP